MFAVMKTGGKQYKVAKNDVIKIEKLESGDSELKAGEVVIFDEVLAVGGEGKTQLGSPTVKGVAVSAEVLEQKKDDKVLIFKKKRRHNYRRKKGHRQQVVVVRIQDIGEGLKAKAAPAKKASSAAKTADKKAEAKPAAPKKAAAPKTEAKKAAPKKTAEKKED